jgi:hypothetical protein
LFIGSVETICTHCTVLSSARMMLSPRIVIPIIHAICSEEKLLENKKT